MGPVAAGARFKRSGAMTLLLWTPYLLGVNYVGGRFASIKCYQI